MVQTDYTPDPVIVNIVVRRVTKPEEVVLDYDKPMEEINRSVADLLATPGVTEVVTASDDVRTTWKRR